MKKILKDIELEKIKGDKKVLIGGCFDVLHPAHFDFITLSKKQGNNLILLLESDDNINRLKGPNRPLNNQITRAKNLSKIDEIDYIVLLSPPKSSEYYYNLVKSIEPDIIAVTSDDPLIFDKKKQAKLVGGRVVEVMKRDMKYSSTSLISKL